MTARQKFVIFGMGILIWVNLLTIALSTWRFGYVDSRTVAQMALIALPPVVLGAFLLPHFGAIVRSSKPRVASRATHTVAMTHARSGR